MKPIEFTHGGNLDSDYYDVGIYSLDRDEALQLAYMILGHFQPVTKGLEQFKKLETKPDIDGTKKYLRSLPEGAVLLNETEETAKQISNMYSSSIKGEI